MLLTKKNTLKKYLKKIKELIEILPILQHSMGDILKRISHTQTNNKFQNTNDKTG